MLDRIFAFSLRYRGGVLLAVAGLVCFGIWAALHLPIDAVPDISTVQVQVNTAVPSLAPEEIEKLVTMPMERELSAVPNLEEMRSISKFGLSQVTLIFRDGTDVYRSRQLVSERLLRAVDQIPPGLSPSLAPIATGLGEIFFYTLDYGAAAKQKPATRFEQLLELKLLQEFTIKPMLRMVPGVIDVNVIGGFDKQIVVMPAPDRLTHLGMTVADLAEIIGKNVENVGGSVVQSAGQQIVVRAPTRVEKLVDIERLPLKYRAGPYPVLVRDVARIAVGAKIRTGAATANGEETVLGTVLMLVGQNSRAVSRRVEERIREIQQRLPDGIEIRPVYNRAKVVDRTIHTVRNNLSEGALLVAGILFLLLGSGRAAAAVASIIPLAFLVALCGMVVGGLSGNLMSLGAIDFGLLVEGSVVVVENSLRRLAEQGHRLGRKLTEPEREAQLLSSCREVGSSVFFGVVIITLVYVPIFALTGVAGKTFRPMATTVILALVGSLLLSFTFMPALACLLFTGAVREKESWLVRFAKWIYKPVLQGAIRAGPLVVVTALGLFGCALWLFTRMGADFMPTLDEGAYAINVYRANSVGLEASVGMEQKTEEVVRRKIPEVTHVFGRTGVSDIATDPASPNEADLYVFFRPRSEWRKERGRPIRKEALENEIARAISLRVPGQMLIFSQPIENRFNEMLQGVRSDVAIKIFGEDYDEIEKLAGQVRRIVRSIRGVSSLVLESSGRAPSLEFVPDREAMARFNVQAAEINDAIAIGLGGKQVGLLVDGVRWYPIVVRFSDPTRAEPLGALQLPVRSEAGGLIPLRQVVSARMVDRVRAFFRENGVRRLAVLVNLEDRDIDTFVNEARARIAREVVFPKGYFVEFGGQYRNLQEARTRLGIVVPIALFSIFVLLYLHSRSLWQSVLLFLSVPLAVTGGVFSLWGSGIPFSISAAVGFLALSGIAVLGALVLVSFFNRLLAQGLSVDEAIRRGCLTRLRPILTTALVASLGFLPMALAQGPGAEVQRPLAIVVIGGVLSSTALNLLLMPILFRWGVLLFGAPRRRRVEEETSQAAVSGLRGGETG
ncbi:MAG: efflux RND transporter permease subunit [Candidatus Methylacidiphilaceae bacterium]